MRHDNRHEPDRGGHGDHGTQEDHRDHEGHGGHGDHLEMSRKMREPWLWTNFTVITLGVWLITSPFTFGYDSTGMTWSDLLSGLLLILFGMLSLWPRWDFIGRWGAAFVGAWLNFAPLLFWARNPAAYVTDSLIGCAVIALTILVPMMPGMAHHVEMRKPGPEVPPGWSYNPSSWPQRAPLIALGFLGWFISRYLAAVQLGYISEGWEPFFGQGTQRVLTSEVSHSMPISDAGLGAFAYTLEALMGWMGATNRWRTMPWMVSFFGILVIPLGLVHVILVILQPVVVGFWCTLCLAAAVVMLFMIPLTVDEVVAMVQFLQKSVRRGNPFWRTFWVGGTLEGEENEDARTPKYGSSPQRFAPAMVWGVTLPWNLLLCMALGVWLMFAPALLGSEAAAADNSPLVGALVVTVTACVTAEVIRAGRYLNVLLGAWIVAAPWLLSGASDLARWNNLIVGAALILLSLPRGSINERYDGWDRYIR